MDKKDVWSEIRSDYEKARYALWCPKGVESWHREEDIGHYHLLKAYLQACDAEPKDELLFARILAMMAEETDISAHDTARYRKYVKPSLDAYERAIASGQKPTDKELKNIRYSARSLLYEFEQRKISYEDRLKYIEGHDKLEGFEFHDSEPAWFELSKDEARLKLEYGDYVVTFLFEGVVDFRADGDPRASYVFDFFCYPTFDVKGLVTFDIDYYKIVCSKISVEMVEQVASDEETIT